MVGSKSTLLQLGFFQTFNYFCSVYSGLLGNRKVAIAEFRGTLTASALSSGPTGERY